MTGTSTSFARGDGTPRTPRRQAGLSCSWSCFIWCNRMALEGSTSLVSSLQRPLIAMSTRTFPSSLNTQVSCLPNLFAQSFIQPLLNHLEPPHSSSEAEHSPSPAECVFLEFNIFCSSHKGSCTHIHTHACSMHLLSQLNHLRVLLVRR